MAATLIEDLTQKHVTFKNVRRRACPKLTNQKVMLLNCSAHISHQTSDKHSKQLKIFSLLSCVTKKRSKSSLLRRKEPKDVARKMT